jgi:hypothetical protein
MNIHRNFRIDEANSDDQYLYVHVAGRGTVCIKREDDGIVVDVLRRLPTDNPDQDCVASTWAHLSDLDPQQ